MTLKFSLFPNSDSNKLSCLFLWTCSLTQLDVILTIAKRKYHWWLKCPQFGFLPSVVLTGTGEHLGEIGQRKFNKNYINKGVAHKDN